MVKVKELREKGVVVGRTQTALLTRANDAVKISMEVAAATLLFSEASTLTKPSLVNLEVFLIKMKNCTRAIVIGISLISKILKHVFRQRLLRSILVSLLCLKTPLCLILVLITSLMLRRAIALDLLQYTVSPMLANTVSL